MSSDCREPDQPSGPPMSCRAMTSAMVRCDEAAWTAFHHQYFDWLYTTALLRGSSHGEADDIVQLTCLRVVRHIKPFEQENAFKNWLKCLMRCVIIDRSRMVTRRHLILEKLAHWQQQRRCLTNNDTLTDSKLDQLHLALAALPYR